MTVELSLFNSLTRRVEVFEPLERGRVRIYACGPTVYDYAHIGNFRFNVWVDVLHRTLEWAGYDVTLVMNVTDVDDNTITGAQRAGESLAVYTQRFTEEFFADLRALRIAEASAYPRATEHIAEMIALVEQLLARDLAYEQDGSVYFRVDAFPDYGKLSHLEPEQLRSTGRVDGDAYDKESVRDFALWKAAKEGEPAWDAPFGSGRPGWHLECSAMSMKYLGATFDMHVGGVDLMFPHHENEIAQSEGATGEPFVRYWLHCAHLIVDGIKMSKSLGNQYTLRQLLDRGHDPLAIRYLLASVHYRRPLNFTFEALEQAGAAVARLGEIVVRLEQEAEALPPEGSGAGRDALRKAGEGFAAAIADDLNTSGALGQVFTLVKVTNAALDEGRLGRDEATAILQWFRDVDRIWNVLSAADEIVERDVEVEDGTLRGIGPPIDEADFDLVVARMRARAAKDFTTADELRDRLLERGIRLEDTPHGVRWHVGRDSESGIA